MEECIIEGKNQNYKGFKFPCTQCGSEIKCRTYRVDQHPKICRNCTTSNLGKSCKGKQNWRKGKIDPNSPSKHPLYESERAFKSRTRRKVSIILEKGDECTVCRKRYPVNCYAFHHRDPSKKEFTLAKWIRRNIPKEEIDKCDLVCLNCHSMLHYGTTMTDGKDYQEFPKDIDVTKHNKHLRKTEVFKQKEVVNCHTK